MSDIKTKVRGTVKTLDKARVFTERLIVDHYDIETDTIITIEGNSDDEWYHLFKMSGT